MEASGEGMWSWWPRSWPERSRTFRYRELSASGLLTSRASMGVQKELAVHQAPQRCEVMYSLVNYGLTLLVCFESMAKIESGTCSSACARAKLTWEPKATGMVIATCHGTWLALAAKSLQSTGVDSSTARLRTPLVC